MGVQALANRPNAPAQYGMSNLSSTQLKLWFDKLATFLADKINEICDTISSDDAAKHIRIALDEYGIETLDDLIEDMQDGDFAANILRLLPSVSATDTVTLQQFANEVAKAISGNAEEIDNVRKHIDSMITPRLYTPYVERAYEDDDNIIFVVDDKRNGFITVGYNIYLDYQRISRCTKNPISEKTYIDLREHVPAGSAGYLSIAAFGEGFGVSFAESDHCYYGPYSNAIAFYVDGIRYSAGIGMTWGEWRNSKLSTKDFSLDDYGVVCINGAAICIGETYTVVTDSDIITADQSYRSAYGLRFSIYNLRSELVSFNNDNIFDYIEGMTWADWKESPYNLLINKASSNAIHRFEAIDNGSWTIDVAVMPDTLIEGIGYSTGVPIDDADLIDEYYDEYYLYDYDSYSPLLNLNVSLEKSKSTKTLLVDKHLKSITLNGIDVLTDDVNSIVDNGDGTITFNYETDTDLNMDLYYTGN